MGVCNSFKKNKAMKYLFFLFFFIGLHLPTSGQVVLQALLSENHEGVVEDPLNYPKQMLLHQWVFKERDGVKSMYKLHLFKNRDLLFSYDVRMRNLITAFYVEIRIKDNKGKIKTLSGIYDKGDKWLRVKMAPTENCAKENMSWSRENKIKDFNRILDFIIREMDRNLDFSCL